MNDRCPDNAGTQANNGCPEMEQQQRETLNVLGQVLLFKFNSQHHPRFDRCIRRDL